MVPCGFSWWRQLLLDSHVAADELTSSHHLASVPGEQGCTACRAPLEIAPDAPADETLQHSKRRKCPPRRCYPADQFVATAFPSDGGEGPHQQQQQVEQRGNAQPAPAASLGNGPQGAIDSVVERGEDRSKSDTLCSLSATLLLSILSNACRLG